MAHKITRREAIKAMGLALGSATFSLSGLSAVAAEKGKEKNKKRLIFYFTATGNSLFIAKHFSDSPLSIPQEMKNDSLNYEADEIGFIFADYAASAPLIVREFIKKAKFKAPYIFSIITYGNFAANVTEWWDNFAKENGVVNNYINTILMVDNYLPVFDMNEQIKMDKRTDENLATIINDITECKNYIPEIPEEMSRMNGMLKELQNRHFPMESERILSIDQELCIQCGICEKVCPSANFHLEDGIMSNSGSCEYCLACIHNCAQKAIKLINGERNPDARYRHPDISLNEIIRSNQQ